MKTTRLFVLLLAMLSTAQLGFAQETKSGFDANNIAYGGGLGVGFGKDAWSLNVAPQVGYRLKLHDKVTIIPGLGLSYHHFSTRQLRSALYRNNLGINAFGNLYLFEYLIVRAQPEVFYTWETRKESDIVVERNNAIVPTLLVGIGYNYHYASITINYDVIQHSYSPYGRVPFFSVDIFF